MTTRSTVVQLIQTPIGRQSQILTAVPYLQAHISKHIQQRKAQGLTPFPSLTIIHTTHFLPLSTAFKPCVICAFEYVKTTENLNPGNRTEIELKQNCDYVNDMYLEVDTPEVTCELVDLPDIVVKPKDVNVYTANGNVSLNFGTGAFNLPSQEGTNTVVQEGYNYQADPLNPGNFEPLTQITWNNKTYNLAIADGVTYLSGSISYTYVDQHGNFIAGPNGQASSPDVNGFGTGNGARVRRANYVKAAEYLGLKYFTTNTFKVDDNNISEYKSMALINFRERRLGPFCVRAFDELIGQEVVYDEIAENHTATGETASGFASGGTQPGYSRVYTQRARGLQTPKPTQPSTRLYIPCIHWFNLERKTSLPVVCMPDGKLVISVETSPINHLFFPAAGIYIQEMVYAYSVAGGVDGTVADPHIVVSRRIPYILPGSGVVENQNSNRTVSLVTCNILLDELIHMMVISRIGFNLITLIREENISISSPDGGDFKINQLKWPTEYLHINDQPAANYDHTKPESAENWWRCGFQTKYDASDYVHFLRRGVNAGGTASTYWKESIQVGCRYERNVVNVIESFGVNIYDTYFYAHENRREFYTHYLPHTYSNGYIAGDKQHNSMFVTFANIPGPYQPSGFVNLSKTKEMFFRLVTRGDISVASKVRLNIQSWCRNFLLIADGSCIVRFV